MNTNVTTCEHRNLLAVAVLITAGLAAGIAPADGAATPLFDAQSFKLDNGLEVVLVPDHRLPVVTHMVWYRVGSADEPPGKSGIAHLLEHLMFKGTSNYPGDTFTRTVQRRHQHRDSRTRGIADKQARHSVERAERRQVLSQCPNRPRLAPAKYHSRCTTHAAALTSKSRHPMNLYATAHRNRPPPPRNCTSTPLRRAAPSCPNT